MRKKGFTYCKNCGGVIHQVFGFLEKWVHTKTNDYDCHLGAKP